jgi:hypothetical protein
MCRGKLTIERMSEIKIYFYFPRPSPGQAQCRFPWQPSAARMTVSCSLRAMSIYPVLSPTNLHHDFLIDIIESIAITSLFK